MKNIKLFYQFKIVIDKCFTPGTDKHSYKKSGCTKEKIFSYSTRRDIIAKTNQISDFISEEFSDIKYIRELKVTHFQEFINVKSSTCTYATLMSYYYFLRKLERMLRQELHLKVNFTDTLVIDKPRNKKRDIAMKEIDLETVIKNCQNSKSEAVLGLKIAKEFGLRASEICKLKGKDIDLERYILHVHEGKGKRSRDLAIDTNSKIRMCEEILLNTNLEERVVKLRPDSLNAFLRRQLLKNNIKLYNKKATGVHAIRKMYAKNLYNAQLTKGMEEKKAKELVSISLGHGKDRRITYTAYIGSK